MARLSGILFATILTVLPTVALADLIVTFGSAPSLPQGTGGTLDVFIHSDSPNGDSLQGFEVTYDINAAGLTFFTDPSGNPDEPQLVNPNYVFAGNSTTEQSILGGGLGGSVNTPTSNVYSQIDTTISGLGVTVSSTDVLLATLHFTGITPGPYTITVDPANTGFFDANGSLIADSVPANGSVTVTASGQVPEPTSLALLGLGASVLFFARRKYRNP